MDSFLFVLNRRVQTNLVSKREGRQTGGDEDDGEGELLGGEHNQLEFAGFCRMSGTKNT